MRRLARAARLLALGWLAAPGCYVPSPAAGAFACSDGDSSCPDGQHCTCGLCVKSDDQAVCALTLQIDTTPLNQQADCPLVLGLTGTAEPDTLCVFEHQAFPARVSAFSDRAAQVPSKFGGAAEFASTWGTARPTAPVQFSGGAADVMLTLDRATPAFKVYVTAKVGDARGAASSGLLVDPPKYQVGAAAEIAAPFGWAALDVGYPAIDVSPADGTRTLYFTGLADFNHGAAIGAASYDPATMQWTPAAAPVLSPPAVGTSYLSPSVLRPGDGSTLLLFDAAVAGQPSDLYAAVRPSDGAAFAQPNTILRGSDCSGCESSGVLYPWSLLDPNDPTQWQLFFTSFARQNAVPHIAIGRTVDAGAHWNINPVPTPGNKLLTMAGIATALAPRVVWDAASALYRMWYVSIADVLNPCSWEIFYATSADGTLWTGTRDTVEPLTVADVPWAAGVAQAKGGLQPGSIEPPAKAGDPYTLWFSPVALLGPAGNQFCLPVSIGKATRN